MSLEINAVVQRLIEQTPQTFERFVVCAAIHSRRFYMAHREMICPYIEDKWRRDFATARYNDLWPIVDTCWRMYNDLDPTTDYFLPKPELLAALADAANGGGMDPKSAEAIFTEVEEDFYREDWRPENFLSIVQGPALKHWLDIRVTKQVIGRLSNSSQISFLQVADIDRVLSEEKKRLLLAKGASAVDMAELMFGSMKYRSMVTSGIRRLDDAMGGGFMRGTVTIAAGANGGGKTVLAMQAALASAKQKTKVVVFTTEQPPIQLLHRVASNFLNVPISDFSNRKNITTQDEVDVMNIPEGIMQDPGMAHKIQELQEHLQYIKCVDWSQGQGFTVTGHFEQEIDELANLGWIPDLIVFDWIGGSLVATVKHEHIRHMYQEAVDFIVAHCKRTGRTGLVLAQLDKNAAKGQKKVRMHMISECKTMTNGAANFVGISCLAEAGVDGESDKALATTQYFNLDKARFGPGGCFAVEAFFKFQRFKAKEASVAGGGG